MTLTFTNIVVPNATSLEAAGVNNSDTVVGAYRAGPPGSTVFGFIKHGDSVTSIQDPGYHFTNADHINDSGEVVGTAFNNPSGPTVGFVYDHGTISALNVPNATETSAQGINNRGDIVGYYDNGGVSHGFLDVNGKFSNIDDPNATGGTFATSINDHGEIVGFYFDKSGTEHGFLDVKGVFTTIDAPMASATEAFDINNRGDIVGDYTDSSGIHGYVERNGSFTSLDVPGASFTVAQGINDHGTVVGLSHNQTFEAFLTHVSPSLI